MNPRFFIAVPVALVIGFLLGGYALFGVSAQSQGPTDLVQYQKYEVHDTFICDSSDSSQQVREWHFDGADRSMRSQQSVDWYVDFDGRKVTRIEYRPDLFPRDGKKYVMVRRMREHDRAREGFDANGDDARWADVFIHNIRLERQSIVRLCGPTR